MRFRFALQAPAVLSALFVAFAASGYGALERPQRTPEATTEGDFDPRDLAGIWRLTRGRGVEPAPPMTPAGMALYEGRVTDGSVAYSALSNDPIYTCNPQGFPRLVFDENEPVEFIHLEGRFLQLFQWERTLREIWLDGRELPSGENLDNLGPAWYGHSVGEWQGNELVVNTVGLDERAWADQGGAYPLSLHARVEERYRRIDADTIEVRLTITDPDFYTAPWTDIPPKIFTREPPDAYEYFGWKGLFSGITEGICAPVNEVEDFNQTFRDPASFGSGAATGR